jgi:hypothetical protein
MHGARVLSITGLLSPLATVMSFDLYLVCFENQQPSGLPRSVIKEAFGDCVVWDRPDHGKTLDYTSIGLGPLSTNPDLICCISVNRPLGGQFAECLFKILCLGNFTLVFPGYKGPLIAKDSVAAHLPPDLGKPILIKRGTDIGDEIRKS